MRDEQSTPDPAPIIRVTRPTHRCKPRRRLGIFGHPPFNCYRLFDGATGRTASRKPRVATRSKRSALGADRAEVPALLAGFEGVGDRCVEGRVDGELQGADVGTFLEPLDDGLGSGCGGDKTLCPEGFNDAFGGGCGERVSFGTAGDGARAVSGAVTVSAIGSEPRAAGRDRLLSTECEEADSTHQQLFELSYEHPAQQVGALTNEAPDPPVRGSSTAAATATRAASSSANSATACVRISASWCLRTTAV